MAAGGAFDAVTTWLQIRRPSSCSIVADGAHMLRLTQDIPPPDQAQRAPSMLKPEGDERRGGSQSEDPCGLMWPHVVPCAQEVPPINGRP